ncbi:MAG TPA: hypothetical protein DCQ06_09500 [Myxococcales bacterium]|nr:hypothetical protein [Myxococcales bacterium]
MGGASGNESGATDECTTKATPCSGQNCSPMGNALLHVGQTFRVAKFTSEILVQALPLVYPPGITSWGNDQG